MKTLFKNQTFKLICLFLILTATSCTEDPVFEFDQAADESEFVESKIISFEDIETMTQETIDGELTEDAESNGKATNAKSSLTIERRSYDFSGETKYGPDSGIQLNGELKLRFTLFHASFAIIRGSLNLEDGSRAAVRGAWVSDGVVYLIIRLSRSDFIYGYGIADENGDIDGRFKLFNRNGRSAGDWSADLTGLTTPSKSIVDFVAADSRFTTLVSALSEAKLVETLKGDGPFTVLAPTNAAFEALEAIPEGDALKQVLLYHVLGKKFRTQKLLRKEIIETLAGENIKVSLNNANEIVINDTVKLIQANIRTSNGIIHVLSSVLIPPSFQLPSIVDIATGNPDFSTLVGALSAADLVETLQGDGPFTVFAPTNAAFEALDAVPSGAALKEVLLYHVAAGKFTGTDLVEKKTVTTVQGEEVTIELIDDKVVLNGSITVTGANIEASNGIVHVINGVLIPPSPQLPSIVEIATGNSDFSTLVDALTAANLVETLQGDGPFTVFAPTNEAFKALDAVPSGDALKEVLLYHVAAGKFTGADLVEKKTVATLQGEEVTIELVDGNVVLNGSITVTGPNIEAANGIVHVINSVLIPPSSQLPSIVDIATGNSDFSTLVSALGTAKLVETLQGEGPFTVFAPTNAAFNALSALPEGDALKEVLLYHVAAGKFTGTDLVEKKTVTTVQGDEVTIELVHGDVILNGHITVTTANIEASNGIVHVINGVLIPPSS